MNKEHSHESNGCFDHEHDVPKQSSATLNATVAAKNETVLRVADMDCSEEVALIEKALRPIEGVCKVQANAVTAKSPLRTTSA